MEKGYWSDSPNGKETLADVSEGAASGFSHFMFAPGWRLRCG
jgi:predicted dithiol-disulfide oxidoreductase (DUF899 family)